MQNFTGSAPSQNQTYLVVSQWATLAQLVVLPSTHSTGSLGQMLQRIYARNYQVGPYKLNCLILGKKGWGKSVYDVSEKGLASFDVTYYKLHSYML